MHDNGHSGITLDEIADEFREKHLKLSIEMNQLTVSVSAMKYSLDSISASTRSIADTLDKQASLILKTFLRSFIALVTCSIVVMIVAIVAITHTEFKGNMQGISVGNPTSHVP